MKPGLAALPLEVWADIFLSPWFTRQELAQILDGMVNRAFANKLNKLLHGCGKHGLRFLKISCKSKQKQKIPNYQASLAVAPHGKRSNNGGRVIWLPNYGECEFPETEMPENIKKFNQLTIGHFDNEVLAFLVKIKPLFTNVFLNIGSVQSAGNLRLLLERLIPMVGSMRGIHCDNDCVEFLQRHSTDKLALAKELDLLNANPASIPAYLNWLCSPHDFGVDAPKFLQMDACSNKIPAIIDTIRKHFLAATTPSTFVIYLQFILPIVATEQDKRVDEFQIENAATKEQLTVRNASFEVPAYIPKIIYYVEIMRHPIGADAKMREWVKQRAYYEKKHNYHADGRPYGGEAEQLISIAWALAIGHISKKNKEGTAMEQGGNEDQSTNDEDEAGPAPAKKMKK